MEWKDKIGSFRQIDVKGMLSTPVGKVMMGRATVAEMSKKSGLDSDAIIGTLRDLIEAHR